MIVLLHDGKILSFFKKSFYSIINAITDVEFKQSASDFRIIRRKVANAIVDMKEYYRFSKGIFSWVGFNTCYIDYQAEKRANGKTKWSFTKLMKYAIEGIVAFTTLPLVIPILIGILAFITAIIMLIVSICVPNQLNIIITVVLFLFSMQFVFMGIIGEYLGHVYIENKNRPIYIIKEKIG